jgi:hypothetical protein
MNDIDGAIAPPNHGDRLRAVTKVLRFTHGTHQRKLGDSVQQALRMLEDVTRLTLQVKAGKKKRSLLFIPFG